MAPLEMAPPGVVLSGRMWWSHRYPFEDEVGGQGEVGE